MARMGRLRKAALAVFLLILVGLNFSAITVLSLRRAGRFSFLINLASLSNLVTIFLGITAYIAIRRRKNMPIVIEFFPFAGKLMERDRRNNENLSAANRIIDALSYYKLVLPTDYAKQLSQCVSATVSSVTEYYAGAIAEKLKHVYPGITDQVILLLYEALTTGMSTQDRWKQRKNDAAPVLAKILVQSGRLRSDPFELSCREGLVGQLLLELQEGFSLDEINELIANFGSVWDHAQAYLQFLQQNGIGFAAEPVPTAELLKLFQEKQSSLPPSESEAAPFEALFELGTKAFRHMLAESNLSLLEIFSLISVALFAISRGERSAWRKRACARLAAMKDASAVVLAQLEFSKEREEETEKTEASAAAKGTLAYLVHNWQDKVNVLKELYPNGFDQEIGSIRGDLTNEDWPPRLRVHIRRTFEYAADQSSVHDVVVKKTWLKQTLRRVFEKLTPATIKRFLEAQTVTPYLITFSVDQGNVRAILEELEPKYNFKQYTSHVRIGAIRDRPFETFCQELQKEFEKRTEKPSEMELIVHELQLSPKNYFGFVRSNITRERAIERLREMFKDILKPDDLLAMIEYQGDIPLQQRMIAAPISDLIVELQNLSPDERRAIELRSATLQKRILESARIPGLRSNAKNADLGRYFLQLKQRKGENLLIDAVGKELYQALRDILPFDRKRCAEIAKDYLETIAALADIGSSRKGNPKATGSAASSRRLPTNG